MIEMCCGPSYYYNYEQDEWRKGEKVPWCSVEEVAKGKYEVRLPALDPDHDCCVHLRDATTQNLVACQLLDGNGNKIVSLRTGASKGSAPTIDPYFADDVPPRGKDPLQHIAIIYDTSFLMNGCYVNLSRYVPRDLPKAALDGTVAITQIVPKEVKEEIYRHFSDHTKEGKAKRARALVASLIDEDGNGFQLQEVELKSNAQPLVSGEILGADSAVDRLLLGYAVELLIRRGYLAVFIATADGEIKLDVAKLRKQDGRKLFLVADHRRTDGNASHSGMDQT